MKLSHIQGATPEEREPNYQKYVRHLEERNRELEKIIENMIVSLIEDDLGTSID